MSIEPLFYEKVEEPMECPCCGHHLVPLDQKNYETLVEHVSDPNGKPSLKTGFGCINGLCSASLDNLRWLYDGEGPWGFGVKNEEFKDGYRSPPNSLQGRLDREYEYNYAER